MYKIKKCSLGKLFEIEHISVAIHDRTRTMYRTMYRTMIRTMDRTMYRIMNRT